MTYAAHPIVEKALAQLRASPDQPALLVLDMACQGHEGEDPDFESVDVVSGARPHPAYADETDPHSPFGELLRRAFAPELDPRELHLLIVEDRSDPQLTARINAIADQWQAVVERFGARYRLWCGGL